MPRHLMRGVLCSADEDGAPTVPARVPGLAFVFEQCRPLHPELQMEPEDMYSPFRKAVEDVNVIVPTYHDKLMWRADEVWDGYSGIR